MFNNYFISPISFSDSIFLTYQGDQPFASFGSKTLVPGITSVCLPSAPPEDNQPRGLISEFLRIFANGDIGDERPWLAMEAGPTGKRQNLYRLDPRSRYTEPLLDAPWLRWHTGTVSFGGRPVPLIWRDCDCEMNAFATHLARQEDTLLPPHLSQCGITVAGDAFLVLRQMWMPVVDILTRKYQRGPDFQREVGPLIKGWWYAVKLRNGWRLYAEDMNELLFAKLMIRV
jgi:hypothetical protein